MHTSLTLILAAAITVAQATSPPYSSHVSNGTSSSPPHTSSSFHSSLPSSSSHVPASSKTSHSIPTQSSSSSGPPVYTTFITTTLCPITYTHYTGSSVTRSTSYTTSIITATSCKSGCTKTPTAPQPPPPPPTDAPAPPPSKPEGPVTVVTNITSFVKCSTPVIEHGTTKYYSTWLTPTYIPSTYITTYTIPPQKPTPFCPPAVTVTETKYATVTIYGNSGHHGGNGGNNGGNGGQNGGNNSDHGGNNGGHGGDTKTHKPTHSPTGPVKPSGTGTHPSGTGNAKPAPVSASNPIYYMPTLSAKAW